MDRRFLVVAAAVTVLWCAGPVRAQPQTILPAAKDGKLDNLVPVPAPDARWVALSESLGLLAFCHDRDYQGANISLVRLDAKGKPAASAMSWKLPRPTAPGLAKIPTYAVSAAFHPKLPLLYVWQDIAIPVPNPPQPLPADAKPLDHLCIYNVAKDPPELVLSLCRGDEYLYGLSGGAVAVSPGGTHLYVPNLRDPKNFSFYKFGRYPLDADGLPLLDDKLAKQPTAVRVKALADQNAGKSVYPPQVTPLEYVNLFPFNFVGAGHSFHFASADAVVVGGYMGLMTWRADDKIVTLHGLPLKTPSNTLLGAHPKLPVVFATRAPSDSVFRVEHAEGYLSLLPRQLTFPKTRLTSPPVVLVKANKLAVGGYYHVYVADLDEKGNVRPEVTRVRVLNPNVRALVYSERFDRLYVGVEQSK
jgi:hypothetical protein